VQERERERERKKETWGRSSPYASIKRGCPPLLTHTIGSTCIVQEMEIKRKYKRRKRKEKREKRGESCC
jgi:hypothetical protein